MVAQARERGHDVHVATLPMSRVARAIELDETRGLMKAVVDAETDRILGAADSSCCCAGAAVGIARASRRVVKPAIAAGQRVWIGRSLRISLMVPVSPSVPGRS